MNYLEPVIKVRSFKPMGVICGSALGSASGSCNDYDVDEKYDELD